MRKIIILTLVCIISASGFAQMRQVKSVIKTIRKSQVSGIVSSEAIEAAKKSQKSIRTSVPQNHTLNTTPLRQKNTSVSRYKLDSLSKAPDLSKYMSLSKPRLPDPGDMLQKEYLEFKKKFEAGECDASPRLLLFWSSHADRKGDSDFAWKAFDRAKSEYLTVPNVLWYFSTEDDIRDKRTYLLRFVIEKDYVFREGGLEKFTPDSIRSMYREQLTELARDYDSSMIPLVDIVYRSEDCNKLIPFRTATDSIISGASSFLPVIQENVFSTLLHEFMEAGQYEEALAYFAKEPLSSYVESDAFGSLRLCDASLMLDDVSKFNHYLQCAFNVDSTVAQEYYDQYYRMCCDNIVENPTNEELIDWILDVNDHPVELALSLTTEIMEKHFPDSYDSYSFEWSDMSQFTQEELEILKAVLYMGRTAIRMDNGRSDDLIRDFLIFNIAFIMTVDSTEIENATGYMDRLSEIAEKNHDPSYDDLRVLLIIGRAYIAAHGMDKPKEAYKILNKASKKVKSMILERAVSMMYWQYLRAVSEAVGKKDAVKRCDSVISGIQKEKS